ncbi:hypothetical protein C5167_009083 [Papaver somniferum]|uniref:Uncharacterized protein n=1 Tax=Papaver somniferum TaxID=3469 RepID=A0A4Y7K0D4_PAPSO|nr:hypothetical protein C5167_009083 [Papaver somniferum]
MLNLSDLRKINIAIYTFNYNKLTRTIYDGSGKVIGRVCEEDQVYMLVHLALALRASKEEERARQDADARAAEEKGGGHASSSHDTTMTENASIMYDGLIQAI